jgi:hypothetical protein
MAYPRRAEIFALPVLATLALSPCRRITASYHPSELPLYKCMNPPHILRPYVAVDSDSDLAHHIGDCLRPADISDPHAEAAQRRIRGGIRLRYDREHFRRPDHDCPH